MDIYNIVSFTGIFVLIGFACLLSADRKNMSWKVIGWGIILQILIGLFVFVVPAAARFVFGRLALAQGQVGENGGGRF